MNEDEIAEAVRRITPYDPLPDVDLATVIGGGKRRLRQRRVLSAAGAGAVLTAAGLVAGLAPLSFGSGDTNPAPAGTIASEAVQTSPADEQLLAGCSKATGKNLRGWQVVAKASEPGYVTAAIALDRTHTGMAICYLGTARLPVPARRSAVFSGVQPVPEEVMYWDVPRVGRIPRRILDEGEATCHSTELRGCVGWLAYEVGRLPLNAARIHVVAKNGRSTDIPVRQGWYAVAWADHNPTGGPDAKWTVYDANGKVLGAKP